MESKICIKCNIEKPYSEFHKRKISKDGYRNDCKLCKIEYDKNYWEKNKEKRHKQDRRARLKREYGISIEEYNKMYKEQNNKCGICGNKETQKQNGKIIHLAIDHDHDTDEIRGLLCSRCNSLLGFVDDDITILQKSIKYLEDNKKMKNKEMELELWYK